MTDQQALEHIDQRMTEARDAEGRLSAKQATIDMTRAAREEWGMDFIAVYTGVHAYDWVAFNHKAHTNLVVPVMQVAPDYFWQVDDVRTAKSNFEAEIKIAQDFYRNQLGETFEFLPTIVQYGSLNSQKWYDLAQQSLDPAHRNDYFDQSFYILNKEFLNYINPNLIYLVTQFYDVDPDKVATKISPYGALNRGNVSVVPGTVCLSPPTTPGLFAIAHELGHAFGLPHTDTIPADQRPSNWVESIMQNGWNGYPNAILLESEKNTLRQSPYFK